MNKPRLIKFLTLLAVIFSIRVSAQVSVTSSSGSGNSPYTTLKAAFDDINAGVLTGTISVSITASTTETATAVLNASGSGSASYSSVVIAPSGGAYTVSGAITAGSPLVDLNGADNVIINGLYNGVASLTFMNTTVSSTAGTSTIRFINDATNDSLVYCNVRGASTGNVNGTVFLSTTTGTIGNDNIVIDHCNIYDAATGTPQHGVQAVGTTTSAALSNDNCVISNCNIYNFFTTLTGGTRGVNIGVGNNGWIVSGNSFYQTAARTGLTSVFQFLSVAPTTNTTGFTVVGNYFGGTQPNALGSAMNVAGSATTAEFRSVIFATSVGVLNSFQGNTFANMTVSVGYSNSAGNVECLLQTNSATIEVGTVTPNLFGDTTGAKSVNISVGASSVFAAMVFAHGGPTNAVVKNNYVTGISLLAGSALRGIQLGNNSGSNNYAVNSYLENNTIGSADGRTSFAASASASVTGIFYNLGSAASSLQTAVGNTLATLKSATGNITGINSSVATANYSIKNNNIFRIITGSTSTTNTVVGILFGSTVAGDTLSGNKIYNLMSLATTGATVVKGIVFSCATTGVNLLTNNAVAGLCLKTTGLGVLQGIYITGGLYTVANNMVSLGRDTTNSSLKTLYDIRGIYPSAATNGSAFYYNSVLITGDSVAANTTSSYALFSGITTSASVGVTFQNNSWYNERNFLNAPAGTIRNYAAYYIGSLSGTAIAGLTTTNNLYSDSTLNTTGAAVLTSVGSVKYPYLSDWKFATTHDLVSMAANPLYTSVNNLAPQFGSPLFNAGTPISTVTTDINGVQRSLTAPTIGAGEWLQAMPVTMLYFKATKVQHGVKLTWSTASELNNKMFVIQRSFDGINFVTIASLRGSGSSNQHNNYEYLDVMNVTKACYRLVQIDFNGTAQYGTIACVNTKQTYNISINPNPVTPQSVISFDLEQEEVVKVMVYDMQAKIVATKLMMVKAGVSTIPFDEFENLANNQVYTVQIQTSEGIQVFRIVKAN